MIINVGNANYAVQSRLYQVSYATQLSPGASREVSLDNKRLCNLGYAIYAMQTRLCNLGHAAHLLTTRRAKRPLTMSAHAMLWYTIYAVHSMLRILCCARTVSFPGPFVQNRQFVRRATVAAFIIISREEIRREEIVEGRQEMRNCEFLSISTTT